MSIFSTRQKRSRRSIPFNYHLSPSYNWPGSPPAYNWSALTPPPSTAWNFPYFSAHSHVPFSPASWGHSPSFPSSNWDSWYPAPPLGTPQVPWSAPLPPVHHYCSPMATCPSCSHYTPIPYWDISTPPATSPAFEVLGFSGSAFDDVDLKAAVPAHIEKIRIYVESPEFTSWTKQWGYATAHRRGGRSITLLDVLEAVYNYFQEPVSIDVLPPQYQGMVAGAYSKRVAKAGGAYDGLTRVDVLNGCRLLSGMRSLSYGDVAGTMYIALELRNKI